MVDSNVKLRRERETSRYRNVAGWGLLFQVYYFPEKKLSRRRWWTLRHAHRAGGRRVTQVVTTKDEISFREAFGEAKAACAEEGVEVAMTRLEAHAGGNVPLFKRKAIEKELTAIAKRARFEKRPVLPVEIPTALLLGWQLRVLGRLTATLQAPRRTLLWVWSRHGNAGKSSFADHLKATFRWGVYSASSASTQRDMGSMYQEEGLIIFDLAKNARCGKKLCEIMELASNVGSTLPSEKYAGSDPTLRASVLIFANAPSPRALRHRAVYQLLVPPPIAGEIVCDGTGNAACGCAYHNRLRADVVTDFVRVV